MILASSQIGHLRNEGESGNRAEISVGAPLIAEINVGGIEYTLRVSEDGLYRIDVNAIDEFDPIVTLSTFDNNVLRVLGIDDDGGDDLNSALGGGVDGGAGLCGSHHGIPRHGRTGRGKRVGTLRQ